MLGHALKVVVAGALALGAWGVWSLITKPMPMSPGFPSALKTWLETGDDSISLRSIDGSIEWACIVPAYQDLDDGLADLGIIADVPLYIPDGTFAIVLTSNDENLEYLLVDFGTYGMWTRERRCHSVERSLSVRTAPGYNERQLVFLPSENQAP
jgi:hypothetical protein